MLENLCTGVVSGDKSSGQMYGAFLKVNLLSCSEEAETSALHKTSDIGRQYGIKGWNVCVKCAVKVFWKITLGKINSSLVQFLYNTTDWSHCHFSL